MEIRIVSLNIWEGGNLLQEALAFLEAQRADIILLQEVYNGQDLDLEPRFRTLQVLKKSLGFTYDDFSAEYRDVDCTNGKSQFGNAILSKYPIISPEAAAFLPSAKPYQGKPVDHRGDPYNLLRTVLDTSVGEIDVINMHGVWDLDGDNFSPMRQKMSSAIIEVVKGRQQVILAGDMNVKPTNMAMKAVEEHLKTVFGDELKTTFNMARKDNPGYGRAAVDMMFRSSNIQVLAHDCPNVDISDHLPLTATLRIGKL